jgi:hypothetical protein
MVRHGKSWIKGASSREGDLKGTLNIVLGEEK